MRLDYDLRDTVICVAFSHDNQYFAGGGQNKNATVYSCHSGELVASFGFPAGEHAHCSPACLART